MTELTLQELLDRDAIYMTLARRAFGVDRRDWELVSSGYAPDAVADYYGTIRNGRDAIVRAIQGVRQYEQTTHFLGNQLINVQGNKAQVETYATAYHRRGPEEPLSDLIKGLRYRHEMERQDGAWVMTKETLVADWIRDDVVLDAGAIPPERKPGHQAPMFPRGAGLDYLLEKAAIEDHLGRYYQAVDRRDYATVLATYTPDAVVWYRDLKCEGAAEILARVKLLDATISSTHFMGTHLVDIQGDRAKLETYVIQYVRSAGVAGETDLTSAIRYIDNLVKVEGSWLTQHRVVTADWSRQDPVSEGSEHKPPCC